MGEKWKVNLGGITGLGEDAKFDCCHAEFEVTVGNIISKSHLSLVTWEIEIHSQSINQSIKQKQNPIDP